VCEGCAALIEATTGYDVETAVALQRLDADFTGREQQSKAEGAGPAEGGTDLASVAKARVQEQDDEVDHANDWRRVRVQFGARRDAEEDRDPQASPSQHLAARAGSPRPSSPPLQRQGTGKRLGVGSPPPLQRQGTGKAASKPERSSPPIAKDTRGGNSRRWLYFNKRTGEASWSKCAALVEVENTLPDLMEYLALEFAAADGDGSGDLSRREFLDLLRVLPLHLSNYQR
jgi:hypothetical protein